MVAVWVQEGLEKLSHVEGQERWWWGATQRLRPGVGGQEEQPHVQGVVAVRAQEGLEELVHVQAQEGRQWGDTPRPR